MTLKEYTHTHTIFYHPDGIADADAGVGVGDGGAIP
jgi:hypothetical protein